MEAAFRLEVGRTCLWFNYEVKNWNSQPQSEAHKKKNIDKSWKWHKIGNGEENCSNNSWVITSICCTFALSLSPHSLLAMLRERQRNPVCVEKFYKMFKLLLLSHPPFVVCESRKGIIYVYLHMRLSKGNSLWGSKRKFGLKIDDLLNH